MDLSEKMNFEIERLQRTRAQYERWLETAPEGTIHFRANPQGWSWLYRAPGSKKPMYLSKKERKLAEALALKRVYRAKLKDIQQQIEAYERCLKSLKKIKRAEYILEHSKALRELTRPYLYDLPENLKAALLTQSEFKADATEAEKVL